MKIIYLLIFLALAGTVWGEENKEEVMPMCADNIFRDCSAPEISNQPPILLNLLGKIGGKWTLAVRRR